MKGPNEPKKDVAMGEEDAENGGNEKEETTTSADRQLLLPDYHLAEWRHELSKADGLPEERARIEKLLLDRIQEEDMSAFYRAICDSPTVGWKLDNAIVEPMTKRNEEEGTRLDLKIEDAKEQYGDSEVREAMLNKANFFCKIGDKGKSVNLYESCYEKGVGAGTRLDSLLSLIRIGLFWNDTALVVSNIHKAKSELEKGGDWERRNKLKVYEALQLLICRDWSKAAGLLTDSIATFMATELLSFENLIFYAVIASMLTFDRPKLREKIVECPEVLQVMEEDEELKEFVLAFFSCRYHTFMTNLVPIARRVQRDRYLGRHYRYFIRSIRLKAYAQFLEPFRSVTLESMGTAFGVSSDFIESDVSSFIANGKLNCKINRVRGVIEANRQDARNRLYHEAIKHGDLLLNKVQKLSRVIDM